MLGDPYFLYRTKRCATSARDVKTLSPVNLVSFDDANRRKMTQDFPLTVCHRKQEAGEEIAKPSNMGEK